jgi:hypothetical protein
MTSTSLSSVINKDLVERLLASSGPVNVIQAGELLYKSLQQIRKSEEEAEQKFLHYQQLIAAVLHLVEGISTVIEHQHAIKKRKKTLQLCLQLCRNLCLGFYQLYNHSQLSDEQKKIAIYMALQMVGQDIALRYRFQTPPSNTLWKISAKLYFFAIKNRYLEDSLVIKTPEFLPLKTINAVIKRNILLILSTTELTDSEDWKVLYAFSAHYADLIRLVSHQQAALFFYWNTQEGFPSQIKMPDQTFSSQDIFICCRDLVEAFQNDRIQLNTTDTKRNKILHHLTGYQKLINDVHPAPPIIFTVSIGFENSWRYLLDRQKRNKIQQLSGNGNVDSNPASDTNFYHFSLSPLDSEKGFVDPNKLPDSSDKQNMIPVKFQQSGHADYFLFEGKNLKVNNGDFVVLANNRNALLAGIVRQQKDLPNFAMRRILVERIQGELSAYSYQLKTDNGSSGNAIVLNENSHQADILLSDSSIKPSTTITLAQRTAQIGHLQQYTGELFRFQLFLSK